MARKKVSTPSIINSWDDVDKAFAYLFSFKIILKYFPKSSIYEVLENSIM